MVRLSALCLLMLVLIVVGQPLSAQQSQLSDPMRPLNQQAEVSLLSTKQPDEAKINTNLWQLTAVLISDQRSVAIINGHSLQQGDLLEGYQVISIKADKVVLKNGQKNLVLRRTGTGLRKDIR